mmetsp:Transcript_30482/g.46718  ORF Transcript_30482/g.46718 Transcript_30482/m.46718 type:complete len:102 (-) Transcript_30482:658-963(-)
MNSDFKNTDNSPFNKGTTTADESEQSMVFSEGSFDLTLDMKRQIRAMLKKLFLQKWRTKWQILGELFWPTFYGLAIYYTAKGMSCEREMEIGSYYYRECTE